MKVNPQEFVSFPKQVVIGFVPRETSAERVEQALDRAGVLPDHVALLSGPEGLEILVTGGPRATRRQRILRRIERIAEEGVHLESAADQLRSGNAVVAVKRVPGDRAPLVREALMSAGVGTHHYFGTRTFD